MRKSWVGGLLVVSLLGAHVPAMAQIPPSNVGGPLTQAAMREAARFSLAGAERTSPSWDRVQRVDSGARLSVTLDDGSQVIGFFVSADERGITMVLTAVRHFRH